MSLRARLTLLVAFCVAGAVVVVSIVAYAVAEDRLVNAVDDTLGGRAQFVADRPFVVGIGEGSFDEVNPSASPATGADHGGSTEGPPDAGGLTDGTLFVNRGPGIPSIDVFQIVDVSSGDVLSSPIDQAVVLPVSDRDLAVGARGQLAPAVVHHLHVAVQRRRPGTARASRCSPARALTVPDATSRAIARSVDSPDRLRGS